MYTIIHMAGQEPTVLTTDYLRPEVIEEIKTFQGFQRIENTVSLSIFVEYNMQLEDCDWYYTQEELENMWKDVDEANKQTDDFGREYNSLGLRWVNESVGWVDQDEEYY